MWVKFHLKANIKGNRINWENSLETSIWRKLSTNAFFYNASANGNFEALKTGRTLEGIFIEK